MRCQRPRFGGVLSPNSSGAQQQKAGVLVLRADPRLPVECGGSQGERQHAQAASAIGHASGYRRHGCANTFPEEDGYLSAKLCRLARMLRSDNRQVMPDVDSLLRDVLYWNNDRRTVQLRWAQRYFQTTEEE